jgi:hypothetical protein
LFPANMRSFVEFVRRQAPVVHALSRMSPDQLKANKITENDRRVQMSLYEKLSSSLRATK